MYKTNYRKVFRNTSYVGHIVWQMSEDYAIATIMGMIKLWRFIIVISVNVEIFWVRVRMLEFSWLDKIHKCSSFITTWYTSSSSIYLHSTKLARHWQIFSLPCSQISRTRLLVRKELPGVRSCWEYQAMLYSSDVFTAHIPVRITTSYN